jgi:hypothetical protein
MASFDARWNLDSRNFHDANGALTVLLPKCQHASILKDYRLISLIHIVGKLFSKVLANRLAPRLNEPVCQNQSAFIKGRLIQDSFKFVQSSAWMLHTKQCSSLMIMIDIARTFDSMAWPFILQILQFMGFSGRWLEWLYVLLSTASMSV